MVGENIFTSLSERPKRLDGHIADYFILNLFVKKKIIKTKNE